jgi:hypothetical protein
MTHLINEPFEGSGWIGLNEDFLFFDGNVNLREFSFQVGKGITIIDEPKFQD